MSAARFSGAEREFFAALADVVFGNPFSPERAALIMRLAPDAPGDLTSDREALARVVAPRLQALVGDVERLGDEDRRLVRGCGAVSAEDALETKLSQKVSAGSMLRVLKRDPGLIGGGNGGTGTSVNYDDGNTRRGDGVEYYASDRSWPNADANLRGLLRGLDSAEQFKTAQKHRNGRRRDSVASMSCA